MQTTHKQTEPTDTQYRDDFYGIDATQLPDVWPDVSKYIQDALDHSNGGFDLRDIFSGLTEGGMQLWVYQPDKIRGAVVTTIVDYPRIRSCILMLCAGENLKEWIGNMDILKSWAQAHGCNKMELYGRKGWSKHFPDWQVHSHIFTEI